MFANLYENPLKSGLWGKRSLLKMSGEKSFRGGIENFRFCLSEELILDDTMMGILSKNTVLGVLFDLLGSIDLHVPGGRLNEIMREGVCMYLGGSLGQR